MNNFYADPDVDSLPLRIQENYTDPDPYHCCLVLYLKDE